MMPRVDAASANGGEKQLWYKRKSCDRCVRLKRPCDSGQPCMRCLAAPIPTACQYSRTKRRPNGTGAAAFLTSTGSLSGAAAWIRGENRSNRQQRPRARVASAVQAATISRSVFSPSQVTGLGGASSRYMGAYLECFGEILRLGEPAELVERFAATIARRRGARPVAVGGGGSAARYCQEGFAFSALAIGALLSGDCQDAIEHVNLMLNANQRLQLLLSEERATSTGAGGNCLVIAQAEAIQKLLLLESLYHFLRGHTELSEECLLHARQCMEVYEAQSKPRTPPEDRELMLVSEILQIVVLQRRNAEDSARGLEHSAAVVDVESGGASGAVQVGAEPVALAHWRAPDSFTSQRRLLMAILFVLRTYLADLAKVKGRTRLSQTTEGLRRRDAFSEAVVEQVVALLRFYGEQGGSGCLMLRCYALAIVYNLIACLPWASGRAARIMRCWRNVIELQSEGTVKVPGMLAFFPNSALIYTAVTQTPVLLDEADRKIVPVFNSMSEACRRNAPNSFSPVSALNVSELEALDRVSEKSYIVTVLGRLWAEWVRSAAEAKAELAGSKY